MTILKNKAIVLAVTGGIAAYKSAELARMLIKQGANVRVAMTESAAKFITPLTLETLTQSPVATSLWGHDAPAEVDHIHLADWADAVVIAPATANIIGKLASGIADDFVSTFLLAVTSPVIVCPAMNVHMYDHPAVKSNLGKLRSYGCRIVEPAAGYLACGYEGKGRLPELDVIVEEIIASLSTNDYKNQAVLVTAGPTRERWDDIRYISNRSTGKMGRAIAEAARRRGADVTLITGPVHADPPYGVKTVNVESTRDMQAAVMDHFAKCDILIKAAAPGDFRPAQCVKGKLKKTDVPPPVELARNPDILKELGPRKGDKIVVGFAAESDNLLENATVKLEKKNLDLIVANQIGVANEAFGASTNRVWIIDREKTIEEIPLQAKEDIANIILDRALALRLKKK